MKRTALLYRSGTDTIDITVPGGIDRLLDFHRSTFGDARMENDGGDGGNGGGGGDGGNDGGKNDKGGDGGNAGGDGDLGFPANTPTSQMSPEQQAAYWKHQSRKHEDRVKNLGDIDKLKADSAELERLRREGMNDTDKALADARKEAADEARAEERGKATSRLFAAEFRAAAAGRFADTKEMTAAARINALIEPLNPQHFLTSDGEVDTDKVQQYVDGIAPAGSTKWPDMGQGRRGGGQQKQTGVNAGRDLFGATSTKKTTTASS